MLFNQGHIKLSLSTIVLGHGTALISVATTEVLPAFRNWTGTGRASLDLARTTGRRSCV